MGLTDLTEKAGPPTVTEELDQAMAFTRELLDQLFSVRDGAIDTPAKPERPLVIGIEARARELRAECGTALELFADIRSRLGATL